MCDWIGSGRPSALGFIEAYPPPKKNRPCPWASRQGRSASRRAALSGAPVQAGRLGTTGHSGYWLLRALVTHCYTLPCLVCVADARRRSLQLGLDKIGLLEAELPRSFQSRQPCWVTSSRGYPLVSAVTTDPMAGLAPRKSRLARSAWSCCATSDLKRPRLKRHNGFVRAYPVGLDAYQLVATRDGVGFQAQYRPNQRLLRLANGRTAKARCVDG